MLGFSNIGPLESFEKTTVLIVDDEPANITVLAEALREQYIIRVAGTGQQAIDAAQLHPLPGVILLDIVMPGIDGYEVCSYVKSHPALHHIPVIFVTGQSSIEDEIKGLELGAEDYLRKPFNLTLVKQRVKAHLHRYLVEKALKESEHRYHIIIEQALDAIILMTGDRKNMVEFNKQAYESLGYTKQEFQGLSLEEIEKDPSHIMQQHLENILREGGGVYETRYCTKGQETRDVLVSVRAIELDGKQFFIHIWHDQTEQIKTQGRLEYLALHDELTGLPNRRSFLKHLNLAINRLSRTGEGFAVHIIDIDHFKDINDSFGHETGDLLLRSAGRRLLDNVRELDVVARYGSDEFAVLQTGVNTASLAVLLADKNIDHFNKPFLLHNKKIETSISVGIATCEQTDGYTAVNMLEYAEIALTLAKKKGNGDYAFHSKELTLQHHRRFLIGTELKKELDNNQGLFLVFQPQVDITASEKIVGAEVLLRWQNSEHGFISPGEFIPIAEERGLIDRVGEFVLRKSCYQWQAWNKDHNIQIKLAVNVAPEEIGTLGFSDRVLSILSETGMPPEYLELEITERSFAMGRSTVKETMLELVAHGISFSIDDFGTGFSSLLYLQQLPIQKLKIAMEFIQDLHRSTTAEIVTATITMAHGLGLIALAEGVEEESQFIYLKQLGCQQIQGYYCHKPMKEDEFVNALLTERCK